MRLSIFRVKIENSFEVYSNDIFKIFRVHLFLIVLMNTLLTLEYLTSCEILIHFLFSDQRSSSLLSEKLAPITDTQGHFSHYPSVSHRLPSTLRLWKKWGVRLEPPGAGNRSIIQQN